MSDENIKAKLLQIATAEQRSNFQRVAALLPEIEAALATGASRAAVVEILNSEGILISPEVFTTYMWRLKNQPAKRVRPAAAE
jgi:hypothetical protein